MSGPQLVTFGCRLNTYESEVMRDLATKAGEGEAIIFNTCAVTSEAERQARQAIRKARRDNPNARIIVTGCAAQVSTAKFAEMPEIDRIIGNDLKLKPEAWGVTPDEARVEVNDIMQVRETAQHLIEGFDGRARAFVQVQQGCDHRCTFCIIPYGRGNSRSVPAGAVVEQVRKLVENGYAEVVLTGVDVTSYGHDLPGKPTLGMLVRRVLKLVPDLPRLRLSSLDPVEIDDDLWAALAEEERLMPHLHLSVQAGADLILKRMKRRHLRADAIAVAEKALRLRPDTVFGADLIAGFPTETDEHFQDSLKIVSEANLTYLHVFPYSPRPGTPAAKMPQLPGGTIKARAAELRAAGQAALTRYLDTQAGRVEEILFEEETLGRTPHFVPVTGLTGTPGTRQKVRLIERISEQMRGEMA
ncbi:tRNA (N(6)-L-threonylcarbamoyladenosine(37)-C(2))-methylthiotransferase MtaB [Elstera cyanobacteriorum]|uniref:tRNA (N(6)-L-threonylcarbamoyladenosine(37)-C(2))- methylthiotransferase MtaB n=1 Tax=Elstera cyanobacteriorum TaxID=2022747 RepID=UPI00235383B3|nr:tRNA (N(6)-L-threonylcarbamoyladenosine(37)-C(2))-methylthiotransferase MtaB [Elstera cyanobacteriorum]